MPVARVTRCREKRKLARAQTEIDRILGESAAEVPKPVCDVCVTCLAGTKVKGAGGK